MRLFCDASEKFETENMFARCLHKLHKSNALHYVSLFIGSGSRFWPTDGIKIDFQESWTEWRTYERRGTTNLLFAFVSSGVIRRITASIRIHPPTARINLWTNKKKWCSRNRLETSPICSLILILRKSAPDQRYKFAVDLVNKISAFVSGR